MLLDQDFCHKQYYHTLPVLRGDQSGPLCNDGLHKMTTKNMGIKAHLLADLGLEGTRVDCVTTLLLFTCFIRG